MRKLLSRDHRHSTDALADKRSARLSLLHCIMETPEAYYLKPTERIPNSHFPLLHYRNVLNQSSQIDAGRVYDLFTDNGWKVNWIFRYGPTQRSHYHSSAHECMAVLTGNATIRFGVADTDPDLQKNTHGSAWEKGGTELQASAGDVFVIPAGVAHKTYDTTPAEFALLTPGTGKGIEGADKKRALSEIELNGFTMLGAYPETSRWDFVEENMNRSEWRVTWSTAKPDRDPVLGKASEGLSGLWKETDRAPL